MATEFARALARQQAESPKFRVVFLSSHASISAALADPQMTDLVTETGGCHLVRYAAPKEKASPCCRLRHHVRGVRRIVRRLAKTERIIAVSGHSPLQTLGAIQGLRLAGIRCPVTYVVHAPFSQTILAGRHDLPDVEKQRDRLSRVRFHLRTCCATTCAHSLEKLVLQRCSRIQALSRYSRDLLEKEYGTEVGAKAQILPGWVDMQRFQLFNRQDARARLPQPWQTDDAIFFSLCRNESRAERAILLEAVAQLRNQQPARPFRVLIGGNAFQPTEHGRETAVQFVGRISEAELPLAYAAADAFIVPTHRNGGTGLSVLESFATGTPVIAPDVGDFPERMARTGRDWLFSPGDARSLAACMSRVLSGELRTDVAPREVASQYAESVLFPSWSDLIVS